MNKNQDIDFIRQAETAINQRITSTTNICNKFNKYKGTSNILQIFIILLFLFIFIGFIWVFNNSNDIIHTFHNIEVSIEPNDKQSDLQEIKSNIKSDKNSILIFKIVLIPICLYFLLHIFNKYLNIQRISKIDSYISKVRNIEDYLKKTLSKIKDIAIEAEKIVLSNDSIIKPQYDVDEVINKYNNIIKTYTNPEKKLLNKILTVLHWISGVLLIGMFLLISTPLITAYIESILKINTYNIFSSIYISMVLIFFMVFQEIFAKDLIINLHKKIKHTITNIFVILGIILTLLFYGLEYYYFVKNRNATFPIILLYFIPLISVGIFTTLLTKLIKTIYFNIGYALLGMLSTGVLGIIISIIISEITSIQFVFILAIFIIFGFFWDGLNITRTLFLLHRITIGWICGIIYGIGFSLRNIWESFKNMFSDGIIEFILFGLLTIIAFFASILFIIIYSIKGIIMFGRGETWNDFEDLYTL